MKQFLVAFAGLFAATIAVVAAYREGAARLEARIPEPPAIMAEDDLPPSIEAEPIPPVVEEQPASSIPVVVEEQPKSSIPRLQPQRDSLGPPGLPQLNLVVRMPSGEWHVRVDNHSWTYRSGLWFDDAGELPPRPVGAKPPAVQQLPRAQAPAVRAVPQRAAARFHSMAICPRCRTAGCPGGACPYGHCSCGACAT